ncbi:MAG: rbsB [Aeromicrobium sp.]|nr:rbsB [Aeromicrobium sp.]
MRPNKRRVTFFAVCAAICLMLTAACGRSGGDASSDKPLIGVSIRFIAGNSWLSTLAKGAETTAKAEGYRVEMADAQGDASTQIQQMKTFINKGAKAIIIEPVGDRNVAAGIEAAKKAGIPVVVVNDRVTPELAKEVACNVYDNGYETARQVGARAAAAAAEKFGKSEPIKLYIQALFPQELVTEQREEGFMKGWDEYFAENPGYETERVPNNYGEALPDKTLDAMRNVVSANPDINVIFNQTDVVMGSITEALRAADLMTSDGQSDVIIAGFDGGMDVVKAMATDKGTPVVASGLNQPAKQSGYAVQEAIAAIKQKPTGECEGSPATRVLPPQIVTPDNASEFVDDKLEFAGSL